MKMKFSKVAALLLAGTMLVTTGCTDYDEDIRDVNKRLDDLSAETLANFNTQSDALKGLETTLKSAQDDIKNNAAKCAADIKALQDADAALKKAMEDADAALKKSMEDADAALKKAMEDADNNLQTAIDNGDAATLAAAKADAKANLDAAKADLEGKINGVQTNLDEAIKDVNDIIATLATKDELAAAKSEMQKELEAQVAILDQRITKAIEDLNGAIETAVGELNAKIDTLDAKKLDKTVFEKYKEEVAAKFVEIEGKIAELDLRLTAEIGRVETELNGKIAALTTRMNEAEAAIAKINNEIIPAINDQIAKLNAKVDADIKDLADYKETTNKTIRVMEEAITALQEGLSSLETKVGKLDEKVEKYYNEILEKLDDYVLKTVFEQYKNDMTVKLQDMKADYEAQIDAAKKLLEGKITALGTELNEKIDATKTELEGKITTLENALNQKIDATKKELNDKIDATKAELEGRITALESRVATAEAKIANLETAKAELEAGLADAVESITEITKEGGVIDSRIAEALSKVFEKYDAEISKINEAIAALAERVDKLEVNVEDLLSRIQSIVYVPDYNDGKITIQYATLNDKVVEGQSKITYKVLPASETNTTLLAEAWKANNSILDFASHEVNVRAAGNEMFKIKNVEANGDLLTLTVETRGLGDEFYAGTKSYSIALLVNYEGNNRSTEYANCTPGEPAQIDMHILKSDKTDITDTENVANYKIQYVDVDGEKKYGHNVLEGHYPAFSIGEGSELYTLAEMTEKGYAIDLVSEIGYSVEGENVFVNAPAEAGEVELGTIAYVSLGEEKAAAVGAVETVKYSYTACGKTVFTTATVTVTKITSKVDFTPVEIKWNYLLDAASDASADVNTVRENYVITIAESSLPSETDWAAVLEGTCTELTIDGAVVDAPGVVFDKDAEGNPVVSLTNFEWGKEYKIVAEYELSNVDVTVSLNVKTLDRAREAITIDLGTQEWKLTRDLEIAAGEISDPLTEVYNKINGPREGQEFTALDGIEEAAFLTDIFANEEHALIDVKNVVGGQDMLEDWTTKLKIAEDGQTVSTVYTYRSPVAFDENGDLKYTKTFTTWYGQEVTLTKTLHFVLPKYDYLHSKHFTAMLEGLYFSSVTPKYKDETGEALDDTKSPLLYYYDVLEVDMKNAFNVIDENGAFLDAEAEAAAGLVRVFEIETPEADRPGITIADNLIYYGGAADYVDVLGHLYIENSDGSRVELPTSFADTYANYQVQKFVPLEKMNGKTIESLVDNADYYTLNILDGIEWKDKRGFDLISNGEFVVGDGTDKTGFANGRNVKDVYQLTIEDEALKEINKLAPNIKNFISWNADNLALTFNYNGMLDLKEPIEIDVKVIIKYTWGPEDSAYVHCVFKKAE